MDKKAYYFSQKLGEQPYMAKKRSGVSYSTLVITLICTVFVLILLFSKRNSISDFFGGRGEGIEVKNGEMLYIGDSIAISGTLSDDGDLISYTHKLYTSDYGFLGVRSRTLNLSEYSGEVFIEGKIEDIKDDLPIIEITSLTAPEVAQDTGLNMPIGTYIEKAGLYFPPEFFETYSLDNNGENGQIKITKISTNSAITIEYFACTSSNANKDCTSLSKNFSQSPEKTFSNAYGVNFYKLQEVTSWYFANGTRYGYFIHNVPEDEIYALGPYITLPNEYYINQYVKPNLPQLCREGDIIWESTTSSTLLLKDGKLVLEAKGKQGENIIACSISLDPSNTFGGTLISVQQEEGSITSSEDGGTTTSSSVNLDPSVAQFPVRSDKNLQFTSRRGHTVILPSTNLSFKEINEDVDFDQAGVHCFASLNVIKYEKDETLKDQLIVDNPAVKVHECTVKKGFTAASNMIYTTIGDKSFIIEILDSAWVDFGNAIQITVQ